MSPPKNPNPNKYIEHVTDIKAPIDVVWNAIFDIDCWKWNKWTRLDAEKVEEGVKGKLKASYDGNDEWETFDFVFGEVNSENHLIQWYGNVGPGGCLFSGCHTMRLDAINSNETRLVHFEKFGGILPALGLGLPFKTLDKNYALMNQSLKRHTEKE